MRRPAKKAVCIALASVVLLAGLFWLVMRGFDWATCAWYGQQTERDTRYAAFVGCMVKTTGGWVPRSELRTQQ